jgi:bacillithiol system protein YtxJ
MNWTPLNTISQLDDIDALSKQQAVLIYKHSTRCHICTTALGRLERKWDAADDATLKPYFLDLLKYREVSDAISQRYGVEHQSPQVLVIRNGKCVYSKTHMEISYDELMTAAG